MHRKDVSVTLLAYTGMIGNTPIISLFPCSPWQQLKNNCPVEISPGKLEARENFQHKHEKSVAGTPPVSLSHSAGESMRRDEVYEGHCLCGQQGEQGIFFSDQLQITGVRARTRCPSASVVLTVLGVREWDLSGPVRMTPLWVTKSGRASLTPC